MIESTQSTGDREDRLGGSVAGTVVVGVDGSRRSDSAVVWAAAEAVARGADLLVIHAVHTGGVDLWSTPPPVRSALREAADPVVQHAVGLALATQPDVVVHGRIAVGPATRMLLRAAEDAQLVVVGRDGRDALARHWLGTITHRVLAHAACPAVAVGSSESGISPSRIARIVVRRSETDADAVALRFALDAARRRHVPVEVVHAVAQPSGPRPEGASGELTFISPAQVVAEAEERQAKELVDWQARYPDVRIVSVVRSGRAADVLAAACRPHDLLVLAHHRDAPFSPEHLRSSVAAALRDAPCAVAVVHSGHAATAGATEHTAHGGDAR